MKYIRTKDGKIFDTQYKPKTFTWDWDVKFIIDDNNLIVYDKRLKDRIANHGQILKQADTIEELCDELVIKYKNEEKPRYVYMEELMKSCNNIGVAFRKYIEWLFVNYKDQLEICNGAIWTDKGLIYVAKMNDKGELELL